MFEKRIVTFYLQLALVAITDYPTIIHFSFFRFYDRILLFSYL